MPRITVGVDAGGTSTVAALASDGEFVRSVQGPPANASSAGIARAGETIAGTVALALDGAEPHALFVGAAGAGRPEVAESLKDALQARFPSSRIGVRDDAYIALRAVVPQGDGVVLVCGTGSIAYAERAGESFRAGGYGYLLGDEGSGYAIGAAALKALLRSYDGRVPRDAFLEEVERAVQAHDVYGVLASVYGDERPVARLAALAPLVLEAANRGERSANKIVQGAALELADLLKGVVKRSQLAGSSAPIVFAGGLLRRNSLLTFLLESRISNDLPSMPIRKEDVEPYVGALAAADALTLV